MIAKHIYARQKLNSRAISPLKHKKFKKKTLSTKRGISSSSSFKGFKKNALKDLKLRMQVIMFVLSKIFGDCPQVKILEVFADHFEEELSIPDIIWITDMPKTTIYSYVDKLLEEKILLEGEKVGKTQFYHLNIEKQEVQIVISLVNYIVSEKLDEKLEERGLKRLEAPVIDIVYVDKKTPFRYLFTVGKSYSHKISDLLNVMEYKQTTKQTTPKFEREACI